MAEETDHTPKKESWIKALLEHLATGIKWKALLKKIWAAIGEETIEAVLAILSGLLLAYLTRRLGW
jgi:hypothetical protein